MRVLFVSQALKNFGFEPLGIMYLSAMAKKHDHETMLCSDEFPDIKASIEEFRPDIIAYSICTGGHKELIDINRALKPQNTLSIFGGPHPTFFPEMIDEEGVDAICVGEGELAFEELLCNLEAGKDITGIQNLHVKKDGVIYKNDVRPLIDDLDTLPYPDREVVYARKRMRENKSKTFMVNRGCPYNCSFCFNHAYYKLYKGKGKRARSRSPENVIDEIKNVRGKFPLEMIDFIDDIFIMDKSWLREFCGLYKKEINLPYCCNVRVNLLDQEVVSLLKDSGCYFVMMGVESGNERIRRELLNRQMSNEQIIEAGKLLRAHGIRFVTNTILGLPTETIQNAVESMEVNAKCGPSYTFVALYHPYPKTELGDYSVVNKFFDGNYEAFTFSVQSKSRMVLQDRSQFENLQKLFSFGVEFPRLQPLIKFLVKLPLGGFYDLLRRLFKGYCGYFRLRPYRLGFFDFIKEAFSFLMSKGR